MISRARQRLDDLDRRYLKTLIGHYQGRPAGVSALAAAMQQEIDTRPTFTLDEQLRIMSREAGASQVDGWYSALGAYLQSVGTVQQAPEVRSFITDEYMRRVAADTRLRAFANNQ